jgi:hypothetical protein
MMGSLADEQPMVDAALAHALREAIPPAWRTAHMDLVFRQGEGARAPAVRLYSPAGHIAAPPVTAAIGHALALLAALIHKHTLACNRITVIVQRDRAGHWSHRVHYLPS